MKQEKIADYAGDYIVSTSEGKSKPAYEKTDLAAKYTSCSKDQVIQVQAETYWYNDPYTLEYEKKI